MSATPNHRVHVFRVTCHQACFTPRLVYPPPGAPEDQTGSVAMSKDLHSRRCKACGRTVDVHVIWEDSLGRIAAAAPADIPAPRAHDAPMVQMGTSPANPRSLPGAGGVR